MISYSTSKVYVKVLSNIFLYNTCEKYVFAQIFDMHEHYDK